MQARVSDPVTWRVFGVLMAGALVGVVGILPYVLTLLERLPPSVGGLAAPDCGCCCHSNSRKAWF